MIPFETAFQVGILFCLYLLPYLLLLLCWRTTGRRLSLLPAGLGLAVCLVGHLAGWLVALWVSSAQIHVDEFKMPLMLIGLPLLIIGMAWGSLLAWFKAPALHAAVSGLIVFGLPFAGVLSMFSLQLLHASPYAIG